MVLCMSPFKLYYYELDGCDEARRWMFAVLFNTPMNIYVQ